VCVTNRCCSANVSGGAISPEGAFGAGTGHSGAEADNGGGGGEGGGGAGGVEDRLQKLLLDLKRELREERKVVSERNPL